MMNDLIFDREACRAVDRAAVEEYGIPGIVLMENAARGAAEVVLRILDQVVPGSRDAARILIVCGRGNNGGDGFAIARHLHNAHVEPTIVPLGEPRPDSDAALNLAICRNMNLKIIDQSDINRAGEFALLVDAIFGTGLDRPVTGRAAEMIERINRCASPVVAIDVPSGLDCDSGHPLGVAVRATHTITFLGLKRGFLSEAVRRYTGRMHVVQIGAPRELLQRFGKAPPGESE